jgi:cysteine desulfurase
MTIYLDHQATTPVNKGVIDTMLPLWNENFGNPHSSEHIIGWTANSHIENSKALIANVLKAESDEIFFYSGATEANNHSIFALSKLAHKSTDRKRVIISEIEHKCVLEASRYWADQYQLDLCLLRVDSEGFVDLDHLSELLKVPTFYCSIIYVNNEIGTIQHIDQISSLLRDKGVLFHSDCAQALKAVDLDTISETIDIATFSGHKIGGPQGIGCSYINSELHNHLEAQILGGGQQQSMRSGTLALPLVVGLGKAFNIANDEAVNLKNRTTLLNKSKFLWNELKRKIPEIELNGPDLKMRHPGNLNIFFPNVLASDLLFSLQPHVCASSGSACSSGSIEPSYVLLASGFNDKRASSSIRFSVSSDTSTQDLTEAVELIDKKYKELLNT